MEAPNRTSKSINGGNAREERYKREERKSQNYISNLIK